MTMIVFDTSTRLQRGSSSSFIPFRCASPRKSAFGRVRSSGKSDNFFRSASSIWQTQQRTRKAHLASAGKSLGVFAASDEPSIQLATAKLPEQVDTEKFATNMYQWASTLTSSGQNLPFTLPLRTQKLPNGFKFSLLRISNGEPVAVAHIAATVENEASVGNVFFVRFYEGEGSQLIRTTKLPTDPQQRLKVIIDGLIDVTTIMRTMKAAIKETAGRSRKQNPN